MENNDEMKWYLKWWVVLAMIFLVLGPFGLPFLYKSSEFNKFMKILLTILVIIYTGYLFVVTWKSGEAAYQRIMELMQILK